MDLKLTPEMAAFRDEVRAFLDAHRAEYAPQAGAERPREAALAWQRKLIDHGYAARTIPKAYGGYGAEPDILKSRIIAEEFTQAGAPRGFANQGISMLVPTLLEVGSEEQKKQWIGPTLRGEVVGRRIGPGQPADQGGGGRRRLSDFGAKNLDEHRGSGRHDLLPGADGAAGAEA